MRKKFLLMLTVLVIALGGSGKLFAQVAKVGNTTYATIDEAIKNWTAGSTLTLLSDVTLSDVVKINSNESRTLDLGTFTMTAAKNRDAFQYVVKGCTSDVGLSIKADATNPGGINASGKAIILHTKPLSGAPDKDRPYTQFFGGVFNASYIVYQGGTFGAGYTGSKAPRFVFWGGEFNGVIYTNRSLVKICGGVFNGQLKMSLDSSSWGNVQGGKFKYLSNLMDSNLDEKIDQGVNNYKFTIGSAKATYDRGIYVDKDGYYVITSAPITEVSAQYPAVYKTTYGGDNYFYYSAAATYGMFYEDASMAPAGAEFWTKPAVTIPETLTGDVVEEIANNTALDDYTPVNLPENAELEIVLVSVGGTFVFDVTPMANGTEVEPDGAITFRLPVPASVTETYAKVYHKETSIGIYEIKGEGNAKYVEVSSADFSEFIVEPITHYEVATYQALINALANDGAYVIMTDNITATATQATGYGKAGIVVEAGDILEGNGNKLTINGAGATWDCAIAMRGGEVKNLTIAGAMRGVFMPGANGDVVVDNCVFEGVIYTFNSDAGSKEYTVTIKNTTLNGWTSFSNAHKAVVFESCEFGKGNGYAFCRPYQATTFIDCEFNEGYEFDTKSTTEVLAFKDCTYNEQSLSAENNAMFYNGGEVVINGTATDVNHYVATIGTQKYLTLQKAINAVQNGETITLIADNKENVNINEKDNVKVTIDGNGKKMTGTIKVVALSSDNDRRITIKNINFVDATSAEVDFITSVETNHYPRITVENCTFTGSGDATDVALRLKSSKNVEIKNCTGTGLHSFLQNTSGWNLTIENVTVTDSKSGLALGTVQGVTVKGCTIDVDGYGIRMDAQYNNNAVIESNTVKAFIPVVVRKASVESNIAFKGENTMNATNTDGIWCAIGTSEYEANGSMPTAATGRVKVALNDTGLAAAGIYGNFVPVAKIGEEEYATLENAIAAATEDAEVVILEAGTYNLPTGKNLKITGAVEGVEFGPIAKPNMGMKNYTFNNVTFNYANDSHYNGLQHSGNLVYNNCTFNGQVFLYGQSETFNKCTFNQTTNNYNVWTYGAKEVAFNECTFNSAGKSVLIYAESASVTNNVSVAKCQFIASQAVEGKAAIEMDSSLTSGINLTIDGGTTAVGFGEGNVSGNSLWNNKKGNATAENNDITVKVNDETVLAPSKMGTWGGIDWTLTFDGTLIIAPTAGTPVPDKNAPTKRTYKVGEWRETVIYKSNGSASAIGGAPYDMNAVKKLIIKEGVTKIGSFTCQFPNLTGEVVIPSTVTYFGQEAFHKTPITKLTFASGGTESLCIANGAFKKTNIEEVSFPGDRPSIEIHHWAFGGSPKLKTAYIPANLTKVWGGEHVDYFDNYNSQTNVSWTNAGSIFTGCTDMETITFETEEIRDFFFAGNRQDTDEDPMVAAADLVAYNSLDKALAAATNDIILCKSATLNDTWTISADQVMTLNLNGKTLSQSKACTASYEMINNKGNLTITGNGKISFTDTSAGDPTFGWGSYTVRNEGNLVVEKATIEHKGAQAFATHMICAIFQYSGSTTINGGTISTPNYRSARLWKGDMTINGGTFNGQVWVQAVDNSAKLTINGGTFSPKGNDASSVFVSNDTYNVALAVADGTFNGKVGCSNATKLAGAISGGKFNEAAVENTNKDLLAEGFVFSSQLVDGYYAVSSEENYVATVGGVGYMTFAEAYNAAETGETINLFADIEATEVILLGKSLTINGNDHKVTSSATRVFRVTVGNTEVTLNKVNMVNNAVRVGTNDIRGISVDDVTGVKLTLNNCSVDFTDASACDWSYAVNVVGGSGHVINVNGGTYEGANVINVRGAGQTVVVKDATLTSLYPNNDLYYGACIYVVQNQDSSVKATGNIFNGDNAIAFNVGVTPLTESDNTDNTKCVVAKIGDTYYTSLKEAFAAAEDDNTIIVLQNSELAESITNAKKVTLDLNGKTITGTDNATGSYAVITNKGNLTINDTKGNGKITLTATNNRDWNAYSSVISNTVGGKLTVNGGTIEHLGGTDMAYAIDNLTNGKGTYAETVVNGGTVKSTYRAIRQFLNGVEAQNILTVNGGTIEGGNKSIWMQDPSKNANTGTLTVAKDAELKGDVYLFVTAGSTEWPVEVSIANEAFVEGYTVLTGNVPAEYIVKNNNGVWGVFDAVAQVNGTNYAFLQDAINAGGEVVVLSDIALTETVTVAKDQVVTLDLNGKTISAAITEQLTKSFAAICNKGTLTVKDSATTRAAGKITVSYEGASFGYGVGLYTISNEGGTLNIESGIVENTTTVSGSMYDAIDNNSTTGNTVLNILGGEVKCQYIGVRQFANSTTYENTVNVTAGRVEGGNTSIWMQNPSSSQPKATIAISGDANITGRLLAGESTGFVFNVTGGTFTTDVAAFCADNFSAVQTGPNTWVVKQTAGELTRTLPQGWSWFSSYVNISGAEGLETLEEELETSGIQIKDEAGRQFAQYSPTSGWYGNLTEASSTKMYSIKTSAAVEVNLEGEFFGVENYQPVLRTGWNYISYPHHEAIDLATALRGFTPVEGDVIKSKKISAIYTSEGWFNAFELNPGEGFMYRSNAANKQVAYTTEAVRSTSRSFVSEAPEHWTADATQYPGNMTMIATLDVEGADYEVAAFVDGEVRGSARPIYVDYLDQYIVVMTINGENVANVTFKYYDLNEGEVYDLNNVVVYSDNAILGSVENPYALTRGTTGIDESSINSINIYPNPTTTDREINLQATCDKVEVFNTLGVKVAEYQNVDTIDALETAGTYVIRVTLNGDVKHCRLIVK